MQSTRPYNNGSPRHARGVVLLALLLIMFLGAILATRAADVWATTRQREREVELLFVGEQYRQAIRHYYFAAPRGQGRVLPARLEDLLDDSRFPVPVRHLRRLYPDPITDQESWGLIRVGDRIAGVYSTSQTTPLKQTGFDSAHAAFEARPTYQEWLFQFIPPRSSRR